MHWIVFIITLIIGLMGALSLYQSGQVLTMDNALMLSPFLITITSACLIFSDKSNISDISSKLFQIDVLLDNNIKSSSKNINEVFSFMNNTYGDFHRGDESQYLTKIYDGKYKGISITIDFLYYIFHYVVVYYVPVTRKVGNSTITTMERRTRTEYRFGLLIDSPNINNIAITSDSGNFKYKDKWTTSSQSFNKNFEVLCNDKMDAAKFLKPTTILEVNRLGELLSNENIEFKRNKLCISFDNDDLLSLNQKFDITDMDFFTKEIKRQNNLEHLNKVLGSIENIMNSSNNNFKGE